MVTKGGGTEGTRPGVLGCAHHLGRWGLNDTGATDRGASAKVERHAIAPGKFRFRRVEGIRPYKSADPDSGRIWWTDGGVHQNLTFPVQPDPISGMHCWHQRVTATPAADDDHYGDVVVDTNKSMDVYREWLAMTKPAPGPDGLRRPLWFDRIARPTPESFTVK